jgi:alkyl sulfatase BDS1-like metallo-beta-lactamase superfamily hydrolase
MGASGAARRRAPSKKRAATIDRLETKLRIPTMRIHYLVKNLAILSCIGGLAYSENLMAQQPAQPKPATEATKATNRALQQYLNFNDREDFDNATRGLIAKPDTLTIRGEKGNVVWDLEAYKAFISVDKPAPDTVNPSLWRHAQLNMQYGLFKVHDKIFQVRGYDLSNITFVRGNTGWIVFDPLVSTEPARAAYDLVSQPLGKLPLVAVVYSHSHADHYGGVRGIVDEKDVKAKKV